MKLFNWLQDPESTIDGDESGEPPLSPELKARLRELEDTPVTEVMIPRALVTALDADVQLRRVRRLKSSKAAYFAVYKGDLDHVLGWISKPQVLDLLHLPSEEIRLSEHVRPVGEISEDTSVARLADAFLKSKSPFLVVKNSLGTTTGVVPLTEFVELVFGFEIGAADAGTGHEVTLLRGYEL
jgi:CBS domain containing-hemolysin-like protein